MGIINIATLHNGSFKIGDTCYKCQARAVAPANLTSTKTHTTIETICGRCGFVHKQTFLNRPVAIHEETRK